jgi:hypothetical protein
VHFITWSEFVPQFEITLKGFLKIATTDEKIVIVDKRYALELTMMDPDKFPIKKVLSALNK